MMYLIASGFWIASVSFLFYVACGFQSNEARKVMYPRYAMFFECGLLLGTVLFLTGVALMLGSVQPLLNK